MENVKAILVAGNPVQGFFFIGPFSSHREALDYLEENEEREPWWVAELLPPLEDQTHARDVLE